MPSSNSDFQIQAKFDGTYNGKDVRVNLRALAHDALEADRFRFDGSVAMGFDHDVAFRAAMIDYLNGGFEALPRILDNLDEPVVDDSQERQ